LASRRVKTCDSAMAPDLFSQLRGTSRWHLILIARRRNRKLAAALTTCHVAMVAACVVMAAAVGISTGLRRTFSEAAVAPAHRSSYGLSFVGVTSPTRASADTHRADVARCGKAAWQSAPSEPGRNSDQDGFEELCTRWNREEAENVQKSKRTLQSGTTSHEAKIRAIDELEYWAIRRGGYDAEIILIGTLRSTDRELAAKANIALKKTWGNHFNVWVNNRMSYAKMLTSQGKAREALQVFDKVIYENPLWGEGYHLRAKFWNFHKDVNRTIDDLEKALENCPNNYLVMVELAITLMDKRQDYPRASKLFESATDLNPMLPTSAFTHHLYTKAPHLKPPEDPPEEDMEVVPPRLLPDRWIEREEATERPNQLFLRVGAELEQWFSRLRERGADARLTRRLWSRLVIAWDPDKHAKELRSFNTQVHDALKARRERELAKVDEEGGMLEMQDMNQEDDEDAAAFLRKLRRERRQAKERKVEEQTAR